MPDLKTNWKYSKLSVLMTSQAFLSVPPGTWLLRNCPCLGRTSDGIFSMTAWVYKPSLWQRPRVIWPGFLFHAWIHSLLIKAKPIPMANLCTLKFHRKFHKAQPSSHSILVLCGSLSLGILAAAASTCLSPTSAFQKIDPPLPTTSARLSSFILRLSTLRLRKRSFSPSVY